VQVAAATLACLPGITSARLRDLAARHGGPVGALAEVLRGTRGEAWQHAATAGRVPEVLASRRPHVYVRGRPGYPIVDELPGMPEVLLAEGTAVDAFDRPRVAVVGTRAATPHGLADAHEIGAVLGAAGITVVSGLAIGIDAAAHDGAIDAGGVPVGVLGTGLDVVYPRRHTMLFERVRAHGLLVSELGYGVQPRREFFPIRNRIIAALADVVVVVEATARGGARITAERAVEYGSRCSRCPGRDATRPPRARTR
jgi:DNA processing protein